MGQFNKEKPKRAKPTLSKPSETSWVAAQKRVDTTVSVLNVDLSKCFFMEMDILNHFLPYFLPKPPQETDAEALEVARKMKSLLNKLTYEKFDSVGSQVMDVIAESPDRDIPVLISQMFSVATTQHHFVSLYTQLCVKIHHFLEERKSKSPFFGGEEE